MPALPAHALNDRARPTGLYNGMIYPLVPFGLRGAIWYQGEANRGDGMLYHEKMKALIGGWRQVWRQGDFPFYYVQLAPYRYGGDPTALPQIWQAQAATLSVPNTGMAVTVDIGNYRNIHPTNKQEVGRRLSLWALAKTYGREGIVYSGPLYESMSVEDGRIRIRFDHVGGGLASRNGKPLDFFEIAGNDKKFVAAEARIDGDTVVVASEQVTQPVAVRLGWHQRATPNLMNKEQLPASPFRTDSW
jgi:sialate O-acetylesterase